MFQAVEPRRVDLATQLSGRPVVHAEEAKESSQRTDIVLETYSIQPCTGLGDIRFDIAAPNGSQGNTCFFEVLEKTFRGPPMAGNRGGSESANSRR